MTNMNRRMFNTGALLTMTGSFLSPSTFAQSSKSKLKIDRIEIFPVRYPTVMRFKFFGSDKKSHASF